MTEPKQPPTPPVDDDRERNMQRRVGNDEGEHSDDKRGNDAAGRDRAETGRHRGQPER